ncbi:E3 ubiquitin-protein ligase MARCHF3-like [Onthophagus taurus]|uniref:E3 ubiquitin-protein ligase MARCHF3-like n=1 Tax=Onthophagus taurus TaxID=166361 RepID=UPI000C1FDDDC|nr:E3 ubiquitin-protein ligase MARCH3-like [Onthophagus taurus]
MSVVSLKDDKEHNGIKTSIDAKQSPSVADGSYGVTNVQVESDKSRPATATFSASSIVCRICQTHSADEILISPCNCKGTLAYVHLPCLERWLNQVSRTYCELCMFRYNSIQTQRYGLCESLRIWIRHPRNRNHVQSDCVIAALLTTVTIGLIAVCIMGMQYFVLEAKKLGINQIWTKGFVSVFLCIILLGYVITLYLMIKDQFLPWYHWWKTTVDVKLLLNPSVTMIEKHSTNT